jgi:hypothetical protein
LKRESPENIELCKSKSMLFFANNGEFTWDPGTYYLTLPYKYVIPAN